MYYFKIPNVENDKKFDDYESCWYYVRSILKDKNTFYKYAVIYNNDKLLSVEIRPGYKPYNFKEFNRLEINNMILDFFILKHPMQKSKIEQMNMYYIKLKTQYKWKKVLEILIGME
jgi:hypothetical protein